MDNSDRAGLAVILMVIGIAEGFWIRVLGNYFWEWKHQLAPVDPSGAGALVSLIAVGFLATGFILFEIGSD
jgi:hypothetical protein